MPRFKSRRDRSQSARFTNNAGWRITNAGELSLSGVGDVKVAWSRTLPPSPSPVSVLKDSADRYVASFVVRTTDEPLPETVGEVGIDLGLSHFAVLSTGQKAVADARKDFHHQLSTRLTRENRTVSVEDLSVKALGRTKLAKSVHDAGWSQFVNMLGYKAARYGRTFTKVGRSLASSQTCSKCWVVDGAKPLHVRIWTCPVCHTVHDRDVNAARIVLAAGRADRQNACGGALGPAA